MIEADRLLQPGILKEEEVIDRAIRPKSLADYTGQQHVRETGWMVRRCSGPAGRHDEPAFTTITW